MMFALLSVVLAVGAFMLWCGYCDIESDREAVRRRPHQVDPH